jgi:hypothetical protein
MEGGEGGEDGGGADSSYEGQMAQRKRAWKRQQDEASGDFEPAASFEGQRDGFVFGNGEHGVGYYRDGGAANIGATGDAAQSGEEGGGGPELVSSSIPSEVTELKERGNREYKEGALQEAATVRTHSSPCVPRAICAGGAR